MCTRNWGLHQQAAAPFPAASAENPPAPQKNSAQDADELATKGNGNGSLKIAGKPRECMGWAQQPFAGTGKLITPDVWPVEVGGPCHHCHALPLTPAEAKLLTHGKADEVESDEEEEEDDDDLGSEDSMEEEESSEEEPPQQAPPAKKSAAKEAAVGGKRKPETPAAKPAAKQAKTPVTAPVKKAETKPEAKAPATAPAKKPEAKPEAKTPKKRTFPNGFEIETLKQVRETRMAGRLRFGKEGRSHWLCAEQAAALRSTAPGSGMTCWSQDQARRPRRLPPCAHQRAQPLPPPCPNPTGPDRRQVCQARPDRGRKVRGPAEVQRQGV